MKNFSLYTWIGGILFIIVIITLIYEIVKLAGLTGTYELISYHEGSNLFYLGFGIIATGACLFLGLKYDINEINRKRKEEKDFYEQEQFLEDFFYHNECIFEIEDKDERKLKREIAIGMLRSFHSGTRNTILNLVYLLDKREKEIKRLQEKISSSINESNPA